MMHEETLWNGVRLLQPADQFRLGTDSVVLASFARPPRGSAVADLGCGGGAVALMLLAGDPTLHVTGIELQPEAAALARENGQINGLNFTVVEGDLRQIEALLPAGSMDYAVSNPPYFPVGSGQTAGTVPLAAARSEETCSLAQLVHAAAWLLRFGGRFCLVHRPERLADLIWELRKQKLEPKRIRFVRHRPQSPVNLVLLEARKGGKPGLQYEPDLILFGEDGQETEECRRIYHR